MYRLSQGHARIMFREEVLVQDAIVVISLVEASMTGMTLMGDVDTLHASFPINPLTDYKKQGLSSFVQYQTIVLLNTYL